MLHNKIGERRAWSQAEDEALKELYEGLKLNRWSLIAQQMQQRFGFAGRTGKQCRQRYNNQLDPGVCHEEWRLQEQKRLYHLHDELGNKWAIISHRLGGGRTDNSVKNHYYSRLRKSLRKLNKVIHQKYKKQLREIQTKVLYKIIQASEEKFKPQPMCDAQTSQHGCTLKNKILMFSYDIGEAGGEENDDDRAYQLITEINDFNRNYKRKPKRFRKLGAPNVDMLDNIDSEEYKKRRVEAEEIEFYEQAGSSFWVSSRCNFQDERDNEEEVSVTHQQVKTQKQKIIFPIILAGQSKLFEDQSKKEQRDFKDQKEERQYKFQKCVNGAGPQILQELGLLEDDMRLPPHPILTRKTSSQFSRMSSDPQQSYEQFKFFEDSENDMRRCAPLLAAPKKQSIIEDKLFQQ